MPAQSKNPEVDVCCSSEERSDSVTGERPESLPRLPAGRELGEPGVEISDEVLDALLSGASTIQAPDHDINADLVLTALSHEYSETITDPRSNTAWRNRATDDEIGDLCQHDAFLPTLGGSEAAGTLFTQLINGIPTTSRASGATVPGPARCDRCRGRSQPGSP
jgi:hypothetical protein